MDKQICMSTTKFSFLTIFVCLLIGFMIYKMYNISEQFIKRLIIDSEKNKEQKIEKIIIEQPNLDDTKKQLVDNIYNPLIPPNRLYPGGRLNNIRQFDNYQMIGFISPSSSSNIRFPLFGRYKYSGRSDRWEYYVIDESRNRIKIPIKIKNDNELYDGETQFINELGEEFVVTLYKFNDFDYRDIIY